MRITECRPVALTAPYIRPRTKPEHPSNGVRNCVWLSIETDEGITGWGETYTGCYATQVAVAALERFARFLVGQDPLDPVSLLQSVRYRNRYWAMRGIGAQCSSAIEAALWDIVGKVKGQPLWQLLGDGQTHPILAYASAGEQRFTPEEIGEEARFYRSQGYRAYKIRCGGGAYESPSNRLEFDQERAAAAREGLGPDALLFVDVGVPQRPVKWEQDQAEAYIKALFPYDVRFIEEPAMTYDLKGYRQLQQLNLVPTAGGESFCCPEEFEPFFEAGAYGVAQPDAAVVGGPASCVEVCKRANEFEVPVCLHSWSAGVGIAQNLQAGWSLGGILAMECPQASHALASEPLREIWSLEDGYLIPPTTKPGLGVEISEELLLKYAYQPGCERDY